MWNIPRVLNKLFPWDVSNITCQFMVEKIQTEKSSISIQPRQSILIVRKSITYLNVCSKSLVFVLSNAHRRNKKLLDPFWIVLWHINSLVHFPLYYVHEKVLRDNSCKIIALSLWDRYKRVFCEIIKKFALYHWNYPPVW